MGRIRAPVLLPFVLAPQEGHLQCWAAVAVALMRYYGRAPLPSQAQFARALLGEACDHAVAPLRALAHAGFDYAEGAGPMPPASLRAELARGHPVPACMRHFIGWHLVVVHGIDQSGTLQVADPLHGPSAWPYPLFARAYRRHYAWTASYRLLAQAGSEAPSTAASAARL